MPSPTKMMLLVCRIRLGIGYLAGSWPVCVILLHPERLFALENTDSSLKCYGFGSDHRLNLNFRGQGTQNLGDELIFEIYMDQNGIMFWTCLTSEYNVLVACVWSTFEFVYMSVALGKCIC